MEQEKTVVLHTFPDISEAKIAQEKLAANNISSFLKDENVLGMDPIGGIELKIFEKDQEAALRIVQA